MVNSSAVFRYAKASCRAGKHTIRRDVVRVVRVVVVGVAVVVTVPSVISVGTISRPQPPVDNGLKSSLQPALRSIVTLFICVAPSPN